MRIQAICVALVQLNLLLAASAQSMEDCTGDTVLLDGDESYGELEDCRTRCYCAALPSNKM